ncbi:two-component system CitB family response regulator [Kushneria sinocarnis]|uniref:Transcriptional regulatory protein n=1 Tax=Kushneria sinocarnis TaxID=595502 RepID=A0A420WZH3_9GAMM|nr:response regulator [Kushneria sinocarnis]RKR06741.1 two-component system CitB family response regulator [Kushneria sinocarnis]
MRVLIVEDDPMVMKLNIDYLARLDGMQLAGRCSDVTTARVVLEREPVDVVLLDIYLGPRSGLELVSWLRERELEVEIVLITAASEPETVREARRLGVTDYLVKPFEFRRFREALETCRQRRRTLEELSGEVDQRSLDALFRAEGSAASGRSGGLPKGLTLHTLRQVVAAILSLESDEFSTETLAETAGMSRVSIRKYLKYLAGRSLLSESFAYGQVGRPSFAYRRLDPEALRQLLAERSAFER